MSAIVTNAKNRIAYTVVRNLGENGIHAHTADFVPLSMSFASRFSRGSFIYPSPFKDQEGFVKCIIEHVHHLKAKVLMPVYEETFLLAKYKETVSQHVAMAIPDYDQILLAHNKDRWMPLARAQGIAVPKTYSVNELKSSGPNTAGIKYPVLIKPHQGGGSWGISHIATKADLDKIISRADYMGKPWDRFFVQEKIEGSVHCVAMLFNRGQLRGHVVYRQLRDLPFTGGQATLRVSLDDPLAVENFRRFLEKLEWHGICQADFVIEAQTGIPYLIDINPVFGALSFRGSQAG
jgi:predicted ATP-grasp superfamily ATP-dependent carboligase